VIGPYLEAVSTYLSLFRRRKYFFFFSILFDSTDLQPAGPIIPSLLLSTTTHTCRQYHTNFRVVSTQKTEREREKEKEKGVKMLFTISGHAEGQAFL
jgi:hypothetical protein